MPVSSDACLLSSCILHLLLYTMLYNFSNKIIYDFQCLLLLFQFHAPSGPQKNPNYLRCRLGSSRDRMFRGSGFLRTSLPFLSFSLSRTKKRKDKEVQEVQLKRTDMCVLLSSSRSSPRGRRAIVGIDNRHSKSHVSKSVSFATTQRLKIL